MIIALRRFGAVLTGRPFGAQAYSELEKEFGTKRVQLDFSGVSSLGSSFGEEVIVPFAKRQDNSMTVLAANAPVRDCINLIATDFGLKIEFK